MDVTIESLLTTEVQERDARLMLEVENRDGKKKSANMVIHSTGMVLVSNLYECLYLGGRLPMTFTGFQKLGFWGVLSGTT